MTTVYIVTSGSYSDYGIDAVFTDRALAEHYVKLNPESNIEEHNANDFSIDNVRKEVKGHAEVYVLSATVSKSHGLTVPSYVEDDGVVIQCDTCNDSRVALPKENHIVEELFEAGIYAFRCRVLSFEGQEHAKKLCVERLQRWRALNAGVA